MRIEAEAALLQLIAQHNARHVAACDNLSRRADLIAVVERRAALAISQLNQSLGLLP